MNADEAKRAVNRLVASYPMQNIGEDTVREMIREFQAFDVDAGDKVVDALKNQSAWFPTPFDVRKVSQQFREGADLAKIREYEDDVVRNVSNVRGITYKQALEARLGALEEYMQEALDYNLDGAGYYAIRIRVLKEMQAVGGVR